MDTTLILIGFGLVLTGAAFFGYPVGRIAGKRQMQRDFESQFEIIEPPPEVVRNAKKRLENSDILEAEILEEVKTR